MRATRFLTGRIRRDESVALLTMIMCLVFAPGESRAEQTPPAAAPVAANVAMADDGPPVAGLTHASLCAAGLLPNPVGPLRKRIRLAALLPSVSVSVSRGVRDLRIASGDATSDHFTLDTSDSLRLTASASWSLDRLLFEHDELALVAAEERIQARQEALAREVTKLYYEQRRLVMALSLRPQAPAIERAELSLRAEETAATLDTLTGGAFARYRDLAHATGRTKAPLCLTPHPRCPCP